MSSYRGQRVNGVSAPAQLEGKYLTGSGCWEWIAYRNRDGYGRVRDVGKVRFAHRVMYERMVGLIPEGLEIDHLCRNRGCVRPDHLEVVTRRENAHRSPIIGKAGLAKPACLKGHPYDEANTRWEQGHRVCRTCKRERFQRWKAGRAVA